MKALLVAQLSFVLFFILYIAVFKRLTHFKLNRVYLLAMVLASAVIPFISIPSLANAGSGLFLEELPTLVVSASKQPSFAPIIDWLSVVYWLGVGVAGLVFLSALLRIRRLRKESGQEDYLVNDRHAFSFFHIMHIGEGIEHDVRNMIEVHERVHQAQWHSIDVLMYTLLRVFFWFNPIVHLAAREVRLNHEFLADEATERSYGTDYQFSLLNQAFDTKVFQLTNSFYSKSIIKDRIMMMNKSKSRAASKAAYVLAVPILVAGLWLNACGDQVGLPDNQQKQISANQVMQSAPNEVKQADEVDVKPQFKGGHDGLLAYFQEGFEYPQELKADNVEGKVTIAFVVNEDGTLSDIQAVKSDDSRLEGPAEQFIKGMPAWTPGTKDGKPVRVKMMLPVQYTMN